MARTIEQRLAEAEAVLRRRKEIARQLLTRQKIIVGGALLSAAGHDADLADRLAKILREKVVSRDLDAIAPILERLTATSPDQTSRDAPPQAIVQGQEIETRSDQADTRQPDQGASFAPAPLASLENVSRRAASRQTRY